MRGTAMMSIKELAELLGVSSDTIRRAARSGLIPSSREGTAYRFDWRKVRRAMEKRAKERPNRRRSTPASAPGGESRPRADESPPTGNTGALTTRLVTGGLSVR